jgi:hypothetical protein
MDRTSAEKEYLPSYVLRVDLAGSSQIDRRLRLYC